MAAAAVESASFDESSREEPSSEHGPTSPPGLSENSKGDSSKKIVLGSDLAKPEKRQAREDFQRASDEETTVAPAAAATEHGQDAGTLELASQELRADKKMIYSIVNEFLGKITFDNPEAEALLLAALKDESSLTPEMHRRLEEVFSPIFFSYPNGLKDRTVWEPVSTAK